MRVLNTTEVEAVSGGTLCFNLLALLCWKPVTHCLPKPVCAPKPVCEPKPVCTPKPPKCGEDTPPPVYN
jgi:hypothetical protein